VRAELGEKQNWVDSSDLATMYHATYGPEFYRVLHQTIHADFRMRKAGTLAKPMARPWTLRPSHIRAAGSALLNGLKLPLLHWQLDQFSRGQMTRRVPSHSQVKL